MPVELIYLIVLVALIIFIITVPKRPVYEATFVAFVIILFITWRWDKLGACLAASFSQTILYTILAFMAFSVVMKETKVMDSCVALITSVCGRFKGGAAYADIVANTFLGALSGGGPQNIPVVGSMTLPSMKKSGVPDALAVNVSAFDSLMGNFIPPSPTYAAAFGIYAGFCAASGTTASSAEMWGVMWIIAAVMIAFRVATVFVSCKIHRVAVVPKEELPRFRDALKSGWKALFLPIIIALPFLLDLLCFGFVADRIGAEAAGMVSKSILLIIPGFAAICSLFLGSTRPKPTELARAFSENVNGIVMIVAMVLFSMMIGNIISVGEIGSFLSGLDLPLALIALIVPILTTVMSMIISSVAITVFFGNMILAVLVAAGANPLLVAAMLPLICGGLSGTIPPSAPCLFIGANILKCDFDGVSGIAVRWSVEQFVFVELLFMAVCLISSVL